MTTVYFIRHASSLRDFSDERMRPLTLEGTLDADRAAEYMEKIHIDAIYSSPYKRAYDTVLPVAMSKGLDIITDERLREREPGKWEGDNFLEYLEMQWEDPTFRIEDGECLRDVQIRNIEALNDIFRANDGGRTVAVGTHGTALSAILNYYDKTFGFKQFMRIIDYMPYIIKVTFENRKKISEHEEFYIDKKNV